ncbi:hypothetical protein GA0074696_4114 [Micromonospora purpureochromogenes]|uniref:Uncharacterized protein n=1 Tax=Micromonospora purpureochromogenes TaxID=47872 RepID=A0A1C4Z7I7_9ACTN|nr:hypothetical protein [Micromonospora purpureochromogenes]SCF28846.1 hypothetical protein GA0074696_4114 [Micromonospora purpureochromogenes]
MTREHLKVPRRFALVRYPDGDDSRVIVAWGIELPDGSAVSVSINDEAVAVCSRAAHCELIHSAELIWIDDATGDVELEGTP